MNAHVLDAAFRIDNESSTSRDALVFEQNAIIAGQTLCHITNQRITEVAKVIFDPTAVRVHAVDAHAENFSALSTEILQAVTELGDFSRANKCEIERVEKQNNPLAFVIGQVDVFEIATVDNGGCIKLRSGVDSIIGMLELL